ncbi:LysR family transcriptional regulator [Flexivirga endophytica]|uniref:LysR family transcriptional regulator n=1 Tax=Flexivirga endophytica TaxID=1849103 RepID=A0A916T4T1_9MICO|nr:LysR family transcriptional regulator [Flexivirga endophytica]GGB28304.1 LysR family transcriptional regulator [Flexivirga endophytica]GHB62067.1 LysR family transcriptional regulator [Flexivirga endophytica]
MLRPEHLLTLREVLRFGSFAQAANRLGYTSSAVSQQMSALEREMGVELFHRSARSIVPTEAAHMLARHSNVVLTEIDRLVAAADQVRNQSAEVTRFGCFPSFATWGLPPLLNRLEPAARDGLRLVIGEPSALLGQLGAKGDLDVVVVYQVGQSGLSWPSSLRRHWLAEDPFVVAYPADWPAPVAPYAIEQFLDLPWILNVPGTGDAAMTDAVFARMGMRPQVAAYCDDLTATLTMVASGLGAAPVPRLGVSAALPDGVLTLRAPWLNLSRSIFALVPADRDTAAVTELLRAMESAIRETPVRHGG